MSIVGNLSDKQSWLTVILVPAVPCWFMLLKMGDTSCCTGSAVAQLLVLLLINSNRRLVCTSLGRIVRSPRVTLSGLFGSMNRCAMMDTLSVFVMVHLL